MPKMTVPDLKKLIQSAEVKAQLRPMKKGMNKRKTVKKNPLKNPVAMYRLNPYNVVQKRAAKMAQVRAKEKRDALLTEKRKVPADKGAKGKSKPKGKGK